MQRINAGIIVCMITVVLAGCETAKSTVSAPFIGMSKDIENAKKAAADGWESAQKADSWTQKNMW